MSYLSKYRKRNNGGWYYCNLCDYHANIPNIFRDHLANAHQDATILAQRMSKQIKREKREDSGKPIRPKPSKYSNYYKYLASKEWGLIRKQVLNRDHHRCRLCNSKDELRVHHRTYARIYREDLDDLTTLCNKCHKLFHGIVDEPTEQMKELPDITVNIKW